MKSELTNKCISIHTRMPMEYYIEPILMYGCKDKTILKQLQKKPEAKKTYGL